jgi:NitT/TauT family transport system substrate-binding protein
MHQFTRRTVLAGAAALAAPALHAQSVPELRSIRSTAKSWLWLAEDFAQSAGHFERAGVKVASIASGRGVNVDALISNAAEIVIGAPTQTMRVQVQGRPLKLIAGTVNKYASHVIVKKAILDRLGVTEAAPVGRKVQALKGLRLGTTGPGAAPDSLLRNLLARERINPDTELQLVTIQGGGPALLAAFERGAVDGFCLSSPTSDLAVQRFGGAYLFHMTRNPPPDLQDYLYIAVSVNERTVTEKPGPLLAYVRGITAALRAMRAQPEAFKAWARAFFSDMDAELFERSHDTDGGIYMADPRISENHFRLNVAFLDAELQALGQPAVPAGFSYAQAVDMRFIDEAMRGS